MFAVQWSKLTKQMRKKSTGVTTEHAVVLRAGVLAEEAEGWANITCEPRESLRKALFTGK
jgi:hypothetical protein